MKRIKVKNYRVITLSLLLGLNLVILSLVLLLSAATTATAQTTSFTYQGRLTDSNNPANGNYDLQFALFDNSSVGTQVGATQTVSTVAVSGGVFTVQLDFGVSAFQEEEALQWALQRGSRSGRVAYQFARDWAGRHGKKR